MSVSICRRLPEREVTGQVVIAIHSRDERYHDHSFARSKVHGHGSSVMCETCVMVPSGMIIHVSEQGDSDSAQISPVGEVAVVSALGTIQRQTQTHGVR